MTFFRKVINNFATNQLFRRFFGVLSPPLLHSPMGTLGRNRKPSSPPPEYTNGRYNLVAVPHGGIVRFV